jgi:hypothetical protein
MELPLWNPFVFGGYPTFANIQAQLFYPVNFLFIPFSAFTPYMISLALILHLAIAGVSMYYVGSRYFENKAANALAAIVYMLSGFIVGHMEHVTMVEGMAWMPLIFLFIEKALVQGKTAYAIYAGLFLGLSALAGHPQTTHVLAFVIIAHMVYRTIVLYAVEKNPKTLAKPALMLVAFVFTGIMISAVQLLPTYELTGLSSRNDSLLFEYAARSGQLSFRDMIILLLPNYFGAASGIYWGDIDISQSLLYIGIVPVFLAGFAMLKARQNPDLIFFSIMTLLSLLICLGEHGFIFRLLFDYVPGFDYFRSPANTAFIYTFFVALLAGHGLNSISVSLNKRTFCIYSISFIIICVVIFSLSPTPPEIWKETAMINIYSGLAFFLVFIIAAACIVLLSGIDPRRKAACCLLLTLLAYTDIYINLSDATPLGKRASPDIYESEPSLISSIKKDSGLSSGWAVGSQLNESEIANGMFRIYTEPRGAQGTKPFGYQRSALHRIFMVEGYDPVEITRHKKLGDTLAPGNFNNFLLINNVKYIVRHAQSTLKVEKRHDFLPRAYIVSSAKFIEDDDKALQELLVFDPRSEVIVSGKGQNVANGQSGTGLARADISRYAGNEVDIRTYSQTDGYLVLSDTYYPGWQAKIDGINVPVLRANYNFRCVSLPKGAHIVNFIFNPTSLKLGLIISLSTLSFVLSVAFCPAILKRLRP